MADFASREYGGAGAPRQKAPSYHAPHGHDQTKQKCHFEVFLTKQKCHFEVFLQPQIDFFPHLRQHFALWPNAAAAGRLFEINMVRKTIKKQVK